VWRKTLGQMGSGLAADGNGDNEIDADDYNVWRTNFGRTAGSGASNSSAVVPELVTIAQVIAGGLSHWSLCGRVSRR
jgi:hypothetical protein